MIDTPMKYCLRCEKGYPATSEFFSLEKRRRGDLSMRNVCRTCRNVQKSHPKTRPPRKKKQQSSCASKPVLGTPERCGSCGTTSGNILGDVDGSTFETYGYLCMKCHRLVRDFHADAERMRKVLGYIKRTRP